MSGRTLLLSLRPEFAEKVFAGTKRVELRRVRPRIEVQDWVLVYVSTPVQAVVGAFQVAGVVENSPATLWRKVREHAGVTRRQFDDYYSGAPKGYGIFLSAVKMLPKPVKLSYLRMIWPDFHPPQSYRYLDLYEARLIKFYRNE